MQVSSDSQMTDALRAEAALQPVVETLARLIRHQSGPAALRPQNARLATLQRRLQVAYQTASLARLRGPAPPRAAAYFEDLGYRLRLLDQLLPCVAGFGRAKPQPLYLAPGPSDDLAAQQSRLTDQTFVALHHLLSPPLQDSGAHAAGAFPDIPMPGNRFFAHVHPAARLARAQNRRESLRFLDIGCGIGLTVLMASELFEEPSGLELDPGYVRVARRLTARTGLADGRIIEADAVAHDGYGDYEVIYLYQPIRERDLLHQLERHLVTTARPGTIIVAPYVGFAERAESLGCALVTGSLYLTQSTAAEAEALHRAACRIGTRLPHPHLAIDPRSGVITPLLRALRAVGHAPG